MSNRLAVLALMLAAVVVVLPDAGHAADFDPQAATDAYLATVTGQAREKSDAYFEGGYLLDAASAALNIIAALLILFSGVSRRFRDFAERLTGLRGVHVIVATALFMLLMTLLTLPFDYYRGFIREHAYGMSNQDIPAWTHDYVIASAITIGAFSLFAAAIYAVIRRAPQNWWLWGTGIATVFTAIAFTAGPVFIAPLFNTYKPMTEGQLKDEILSLARANGIPATDVYQFDASKQTKRISANVSGLFGTTRISLNDNLLNRATPSEVKFVMSHEMGHYVLNHGYKFLIAFVVYFGVILVIVSILFRAFLRRFGQGLGLRDQADPAALPALFALATLLFYLATPISNTIIRAQEAEADIFALNASREPDAFATVSLKLAEYRKLDPAPWEEVIFYDHPSGRSRISMAMHWKAEHLSELPQPEPAAPPPAEPAATPAGQDGAAPTLSP